MARSRAHRVTSPGLGAAHLLLLGCCGALACASGTGASSDEPGGSGASAAGGAAGGSGAASGGSSSVATGATTGAAGATGATSSLGGGAGGAEAVPFAHVRAVQVSGETQSYVFAVSVESADIDCSQFADWWEVLSEEGELLFRRILEHSHTDENGTSDPDAPGNTFTRSGGPVPVAGDRTVLVRAHMSTGGYEGDLMIGSPDEGFRIATDVPPGFAADVESLPPQPGACAF